MRIFRVLYTTSLMDIRNRLKKKKKAVISEAQKLIIKYENLIIEPIFSNSNNVSTGYDSIDFKDVEFFDENFINSINQELEKPVSNTTFRRSEMTFKERAFINGIIRKTKPKNIVEIGVSAGGSSCVILNAIKDLDDSKLFSFDYSTKWYKKTKDNITRDSGFLVDTLMPNQKQKWKIFTGGVSSKYFSELPTEGIDICFIDSFHWNPGEHINILEILPHLKDNAIVIYHDTVFHTFVKDPYATTNCVALNSLPGKRITLNSEKTAGVANIGAVIINKQQPLEDNLFTNLTLPWSHQEVPIEDFNSLFLYFRQYYSTNNQRIFLYYYVFYMLNIPRHTLDSMFQTSKLG